MINVFGSRLHALRMSQNLEPEAIAESLHISPQYIKYYEKGWREPTLEIYIMLAEYFHVSLDYLSGRTDNPKINV